MHADVLVLLLRCRRRLSTAWPEVRAWAPGKGSTPPHLGVPQSPTCITMHPKLSVPVGDDEDSSTIFERAITCIWSQDDGSE